MPLPEMLNSATKYAGRGLLVFPIMPDKKTPLTAHGCKDATSELNQVCEWWQRWPDANIGLACGEHSGLAVLDFDVKDGKPGLRTLSRLRREYSIETLTARTPSGGIHLFFRHPGAQIRNSVDAFHEFPAMDVRTSGGYVLVAPSVVDGAPYRWIHVRPPADLPQTLVAMLTRRDSHHAVLQPRRWPVNRLDAIERAGRYLSAVPPAVQGQAGDISTYRLACKLVRGFSLTDNEALALLSGWNLRCSPPWSESELRSKITSARRNGLEPYGARLETR